MRIYTFKTQGMALGGIVVVAAYDANKARRLMKKVVFAKWNLPLHKKRLNDLKSIRMSSKATDLRGEAQVLYEWDGNY